MLISTKLNSSAGADKVGSGVVRDVGIREVLQAKALIVRDISRLSGGEDAPAI